MRKSLIIGGVAVGLSVFGLAGRADAHHPTYKSDCSGFTASGTDYPAGSHVTIKTDNVARMDKDFDGEGFTFSRSWDPSLDHPWSIVVFSPDGIGNVNASGTQLHCTTPSTPVPTTQPPATTVPPATTAPPVTTAPTTIPPVDTSVAPPTTAPAIVDSTPPITPAPQDVPTTACVPPGGTIGPGAHLCAALPATGSGDAIPLVAVGAGIVLAGILLLAVRRVPRSA